MGLGDASAGPPLWVDTDGGIDDLLALVWLHGMGADIRMLSTVAGNVEVDAATRNVLGVRALLGATWPVYMGLGAPLSRSLRTVTDVHGRTGTGGFRFLPSEDGRIEGGWPELSSAVRGVPAGTRLLALGPLTNLARLAMDGVSLSGIHTVTVMGGALDVPGNITEYAEYNFYADPEAARVVLTSCGRLRLVPRDTVMGLRTPASLADGASPAADRLGVFVAALLQDYARRPAYDPVAAWAAHAPEDLAYRTEVVAMDAEHRGRVRRHARGKRADVALPPNPETFARVFADGIRRALRGRGGAPAHRP